MTSEIALANVPAKSVPDRPSVTSFDSGYEHSLEHLLEVRALVEEADQETSVILDWFRATA